MTKLLLDSSDEIAHKYRVSEIHQLIVSKLKLTLLKSDLGKRFNEIQ
jgi:hypothetical protein